MANKYFLGVDVGSNSVGWATTDDDYNLLRLKGKTTWGARIFDEAKGAKDRRTLRVNKRRLARRKYRLELLQGLFALEMAKIDSTFFLRLDESSFHFEDRPSKNTYACPLFKDKKAEKEYYKAFPTIWHLRKALIENEDRAFDDLRKVYLAVHHIIKYRGNFLRDGDLDATILDSEVFEKINQLLLNIAQEENAEDEYETQAISASSYQMIIDVVLSNENKATKKKNLKSLISFKGLDEYVDMLSQLMLGNKFDLKKIDSTLDLVIKFDDSFEETLINAYNSIGYKAELIELAKIIFDYCVLYKIIKGRRYLSEGMIGVYESHKKQLAQLKNILKEIDSAKGSESKYYAEIFKNRNNPDNYSAFVHVNSEQKRVSVEDFNNKIKKILLDNLDVLRDQKTARELILLSEKNELLLKIANVSTSIIPHQLHKNELKIILENAAKRFPFLSDLRDQIITLFLHRIPYYYGPLDDRSPYSSIVRKTYETITPWNIQDIIDDAETRKKFISRLTKSCLELKGEKSLPKNSIVYQDYVNLDRLNVMEINGSKIDQTLKLELFSLINSSKKTSLDKIKKYLTKKYPEYHHDIAISKVALEIDFDASSRSIFNEAFDLEKDLSLIEEIIFLLTIYSDDTRPAIELIKKRFPLLTANQLMVIKKAKMTGWGSFSNYYLTKLVTIDDNGVASSILDLLRDTSENYQQIRNNPKYGFQSLVDSFNLERVGDVLPKDQVQEVLNSMPAIFRRSVNQTLRVIDEISHIKNQAPARIFIEVTREKDNKKKGKLTISRQKELRLFLTSLSKDIEYAQTVKSLGTELDELDEAKLRGKHLFLYFKQLGLDLYTGERIDINELMTSTKYDIDHIIPQSLLKDDSLDNLVLVERSANQRIKSNKYPLPDQLKTEKVRRIWIFLHKKKAISDKKYNNLIRATPLSEGELQDFVNRQINIVNYSNIGIREILNIKYPNTKVIFTKAQYPSFVRQYLEIPKLRELNDCHHAVDAYLNIVAGNILYDKFNDLRVIFSRMRHGDDTTLNMEKVLEMTLANKLLRAKVVNNSYRHDFLLTYMNNYVNAEFYKQTIYPAGTNDQLIATHTAIDDPRRDVSKYGGFSDLKSSHLVPIHYSSPKKQSKTLIRLPLLLKKELCKESDIIEYAKTLEENKELKITFVGKPIFPNQKVKINGLNLLMRSKGESINYIPITPVFLNQSDSIFLFKSIKYEDELDIDNDEVIRYTDSLKTQFISFSKIRFEELFKNVINLSFSKIYDDCPMIARIRLFPKQLDYFRTLTMKKQLDVIINTLKLFTSNSRYSVLEGPFKGSLLWLKTLNITKEDITVINESVTGLFSSSYRL